jgi:hypothetical protein
MKVKIYPHCLITFIVIIFASCDKSNKIIEDDESLIFSVQYSGGWTMIDENLKINTNVTHYSGSYHDRESMKRKSYQTTIKTPNELWDNLTKTFDLETFKKIKDGSCRACVDGVDETFSITINGETYSFYNGVVDENYQQMQDFFDVIYEQIENFRSNAVYK